MEYRLIYNYNGNHWTLINKSSNPEGVIEYINNNIAELEDAYDEEAPNYFSVLLYVDGVHKASWEGDPYDLIYFMEIVTGKRKLINR